MLGRHPGFTIVAIVSLALGIGLNTAIFSIVNAVLLRPLPVDRPNELVAVYTSADSGDAYSTSSYADYADLAAGASTLDGLTAHTLMFVGVDRGDVTRTTLGEIVSPNYFSVLGVRLAVGRGFEPGDERVTTPPTTVISSRMWQRDFGRDPNVVGRTIQIRGRAYSIVGVAPDSFGGLAPGMSAELWLPAGCVDDIEPVGMIDVTTSPTGTNRIDRRGQRWLFLTGRLKPGVTTSQARASLTRLMADLEQAYPQTNKDRRLTLVPASSVRIHPELDASLTPGAAALMIAVGLVLLVACANLASLLLARATARSREMAIRLAIGASRVHLVRQLTIESLVLALAGGLAGLALATWATRAIAAIQPPIEIGVSFDFAPDSRVLLFTLAISTLTGLLFGLAPALRASRPNLVPSLKGEVVGGERRRFDLRRWLVASEIALSMVLLVTGGLLLRSTLAAARADTGVNADRVVYASVNALKTYSDRGRAMQFYDEGARRIASIPGVTAVARASWMPLSLNHNTSVIEIDGVRGPAPEGGIDVDTTDVSAGYFQVMGVPILTGRAFDSRDTSTSARVAIVSAAAARKYWPGQSAIGRQFRNRHDATYTVVGVSADYAVRSVGEAPRPLVHFAIDQTQPGYQSFAVATDRPAHELVAPVRQAIVTLEPARSVRRAAAALESRGHRAVPRARERGAARLAQHARAVARDDRPVRRHRIQRQPADTRDRHPHGARRQPGPGRPPGGHRRLDARRQPAARWGQSPQASSGGCSPARSTASRPSTRSRGSRRSDRSPSRRWRRRCCLPAVPRASTPSLRCASCSKVWNPPSLTNRDGPNEPDEPSEPSEPKRT